MNDTENKRDMPYSAPLCCDDIVMDDQWWFPWTDGNGICRLDPNNKDDIHIYQIPEAPLVGRRITTSIFKMGKYIIVCPFNIEAITVVDTDTDEVHTIMLEKRTPKAGRIFDNKFWSGIAYKKYIYFAGHYYPAIVRLDCETWQLKYIDSWRSEIEKRADYCISLPFFF